MPNEHIHPIHAGMLPAEAKAELLGQNPKVFWFVGLSGSGKSTLAKALERELHAQKRPVALLDGDNLRSGLNADLGFTPTDREENLRRVAEVAKLMQHNGLIVLASFITPQEVQREKVKAILGESYREVFIATPLEVCEARDVKGLYAKARAGEIPNFTGISAPFDVPEKPDFALDTSTMTETEAVEKLLRYILKETSVN